MYVYYSKALVVVVKWVSKRFGTCLGICLPLGYTHKKNKSRTRLLSLRLALKGSTQIPGPNKNILIARQNKGVNETRAEIIPRGRHNSNHRANEITHEASKQTERAGGRGGAGERDGRWDPYVKRSVRRTRGKILQFHLSKRHKMIMCRKLFWNRFLKLTGRTYFLPKKRQGRESTSPLGSSLLRNRFAASNKH